MKNLNYAVLIFLIGGLMSCGETNSSKNQTEKPDQEVKVEESEVPEKKAEAEEEYLVQRVKTPETFSMRGILASVGETGQEPMEYNVNISNGKQGDELKYVSFELWMDEPGTFEEVRAWEMDYLSGDNDFKKYKNAVVEIIHTIDKRLVAIDVFPVASAPDNLEAGVLLAKGGLLEVHEHGDGPGSLILKPNDGTDPLVFEGDYQVEMEAEHQALVGQEVALLYKVVQQFMYKSGKIVGKAK